MEVFVQLIFIFFERVASQLYATSSSDETGEVFNRYTAAVKNCKDTSQRQLIWSHDTQFVLNLKCCNFRHFTIEEKTYLLIVRDPVATDINEEHEWLTFSYKFSLAIQES